MVELNNPTVSDNTESGALNMVKLTIDNCEVVVPEHTTILDAAKSVGIQIPTLCYLRDLNEIGGCRVCVVEVEGPLAGCLTPSGGMRWITFPTASTPPASITANRGST